MYFKTIYHKFKDGQTAKFTIRDRIISSELFYYANVINTDDSTYRSLDKNEQEKFYGMEITDGNYKSINYKDVDKLINDILNKYGNEWLTTEI
jgi:hypothetical protein